MNQPSAQQRQKRVSEREAVVKCSHTQADRSDAWVESHNENWQLATNSVFQLFAAGLVFSSR